MKENKSTSAVPVKIFHIVHRLIWPTKNNGSILYRCPYISKQYQSNRLSIIIVFRVQNHWLTLLFVPYQFRALYHAELIGLPITC